MYELSGDVAWSFPELAAELTTATGKEITYQDVSPDRHLEIVLVTGPGMFPIIDATLNTPTLTGRSAASSHR